jgi:hypothetical protein
MFPAAFATSSGTVRKKIEKRVRRNMAIAHKTGKLAAENPGLEEDDLYDESGLPA